MMFSIKWMLLLVLVTTISAKAIYRIEKINPAPLRLESASISRFNEFSENRFNPYFVGSLNTVLRYYDLDTLHDMSQGCDVDTNAAFYLKVLRERGVLVYRMKNVQTRVLRVCLEHNIPVLLFGGMSTPLLSFNGVVADVMFEYSTPEPGRNIPLGIEEEFRFGTARKLQMLLNERENPVLVSNVSGVPYSSFTMACVLGTPAFSIDSIAAHIRAGMENADLSIKMPEFELVDGTDLFLKEKISFAAKEKEQLGHVENYKEKETFKTTAALLVATGVAIVAVRIIIEALFNNQREPEPLPPEPIQ